jgi:uncharacterized protein YkwD
MPLRLFNFRAPKDCSPKSTWHTDLALAVSTSQTSLSLRPPASFRSPANTLPNTHSATLAKSLASMRSFAGLDPAPARALTPTKALALPNPVGSTKSLAGDYATRWAQALGSRLSRSSAQRADLCAVRLLTIGLLVAASFSASLAVVQAAPQTISPERALFDSANRERVAQGLSLLRWDEALANAARNHALLMAQRNTLSHQFAGEAALQDRGRLSGARFTEIAENVAEGPSADVIHASWMHSPPHRANLLDPELTAVGIAVVGIGARDGADAGRAGLAGNGSGTLFAVEDFSQSVASLSFADQERQVAAVLTVRGLQIVTSNAQFVSSSAKTSSGANGNVVITDGNTIGGSEDARKTCEMDRGWTGNRPGLVVRYETGDLSRLPDDLEQKIRSGQFRAAAVGACEAAGSSRGFTRFRVAILLY